MTPLRALSDACRALCGKNAMHTGRHDDACLALAKAVHVRDAVVKVMTEHRSEAGARLCHACSAPLGGDFPSLVAHIADEIEALILSERGREQ